MSDACVLLLSNVVAGGVDPGCSANKCDVLRPKASATKAPVDFIIVDLTFAGVTAPGYSRAYAISAIIVDSALSRPPSIRSSK